MKKFNSLPMSRRDILTKVLPSCAAAGLMPGLVSKSFGSCAAPLFLQEGVHKFDNAYTFSRRVTQRQLRTRLLSRYIQLVQFLVEDLGEEKALDLIKRFTEKRMFETGKRGAERAGDDSFKAYMNIFKRPAMLNTLTMEVVEDTDTVFEIKVTECISHEIYKAAKFDGKFGFACVCYGDYAWAEGWNPKIKLVRDKTLMEGHDCCNHRYIWTG